MLQPITTIEIQLELSKNSALVLPQFQRISPPLLRMRQLHVAKYSQLLHKIADTVAVTRMQKFTELSSFL